MKTYHDMVDAVYRGQGYNFHGPGVVIRAPALREQPKYLEPLVTCPSYHFGNMLSQLADAPHDDVQQPLAYIILGHMFELGLERVAIVYDTAKEPATFVVTFEIIEGGRLRVSICCHDRTGRLSVEPNRWIAFTTPYSESKKAWPMIWVAAIGLEMLAHPSVQFVLRDPSNGMETFAKNRVRRGEAPIGDMKIVHLTKRIVIGGNAIGGRAGSHAKKSPHDRQGHWRHSEREIIGWEEVKPESGQYAGVVMWRKWIDTFAVNGGKRVRKPRHITDNAAPQFKVVR